MIAMDWVSQLLRAFKEAPFLQGMTAALATFILEDPATLASGLLVADGAMGFKTAFIGLTLGIAGGDLGLYLLGRMAREPVLRRNWIDEAKLAKAEDWFKRKGLAAVVISRFLPGTRLPTYLAAGALKVSPWGFLMATVSATVVWTFLLLTLSVRLGQSILGRATQFKLLVGLGLVVLVALVQFVLGRLRSGPHPPRIRSSFEFWPPYVFYPPVLIYSLWLAIRHWGLTLPTVANPSIYSGGMIMESKGQILALVPLEQRCWIAPWISFQVPPPEVSFSGERAFAAMQEGGLSYPIVAKPDVGQRGAGVRPVRNHTELQDYLDQSPPRADVILQSLVPFEHEAGIFYYRMPGEEKGHIFSITLKEFPELLGDGIRTIRELILAHERARLLGKLFLKRHAEVLDQVLSTGQRFRLVFAGNHCQGAVFRDGSAIETPELAARIHEIGSAIPGFFFGRFDLRFRSLEALQRGEDFQIVEINGASAEATHIWDPEARLLDAYRTLFRQFDILFRIGALNRARGHRPMGILQVLRDWNAYSRRARAYPATH